MSYFYVKLLCMTSSRWPEPVRDPLPARVLTEQDIKDALLLCVQHSCEPEDPEFDVVTFGALGAAQAALIECAEAIRMEAQALSGRLGFLSDPFVASRVSEAVTARRVARRIIDNLRQWLPEVVVRCDDAPVETVQVQIDIDGEVSGPRTWIDVEGCGRPESQFLVPAELWENLKQAREQVEAAELDIIGYAARAYPDRDLAIYMRFLGG
jgi:phosphatidate phosphatase APP1